MSRSTILSELNSIFSEVFEDESIRLTEQTTAPDVEGWDSLTHIQVVTAVEKHYGIKFKLSEIMKFKNIGDLCACIEKHTS